MTALHLCNLSCHWKQPNPRQQPSHYQCLQSKLYHICDSEHCTYQYPIQSHSCSDLSFIEDDDDSDIPQTIAPPPSPKLIMMKWYCPLTKVYRYYNQMETHRRYCHGTLGLLIHQYRRERIMYQQKHPLHEFALDDDHDTDPRETDELDLSNVTRSYMTQLHQQFNDPMLAMTHAMAALTTTTTTTMTASKQRRMKQLLLQQQQPRIPHPLGIQQDHLLIVYANMRMVFIRILEHCQIIQHFLVAEINYIIDCCNTLYSRMIATETWRISDARLQYTECYHIWMVLYNMKKKDGLWIPKQPVTYDTKDDEIDYEVMIIPMPVVRKWFPDEKKLRQQFSVLQITDSITISSIQLKHTDMKKNSTSTTIAALHPIHPDRFTKCRHLFHAALTESVRLKYNIDQQQQQDK